VFKSAWRKRFRLACLFLCVAVAIGVRAEEPDDLANAIIAHIHTRLMASAQPMSTEDANRVGSFARYIQKRFYYPTNPLDLQSAAIAAIDATDPAADAAVMTQAAIAGMVDSLGHGTRFLTSLGSEGGGAPGDAAVTPSSRQVGSLMLVTLPTMKVTDGNTVPTCTDFVRYFEVKTEGHLTGVVLDLRGNEGGPLTDSACLAGLFLRKSSVLFQVLSKQGELVKYESKPTVHIDLPVAVLINNRTDNGGLLVAAVLQDQRRATIIGEQKTNVNGAVASLVFPPGVDRALVLATGEILLPNKQPLAAGVRVDVSMPATDDDALLAAARDSLTKHR
jgi:hypothetical protein